MRVLVGWDIEAEVELLTMYLQVANNHVEVAADPDALLTCFKIEPFDVVLFPVTFPDSDGAFRVMQCLHQIDPRIAILVAARPGEVYPLSRLIRHGLRSHIYRDPEGEFLFLLQTLLESTLEGKQAEEARIIAGRLREEIDSVRKLQESILPANLRALTGYTLKARYEPAQIRVSNQNPIVLAGGDYYHAFRIDNQRMVLLVGDASGHGMKACMSIMSMHTLINQLHDSFGQKPHEFVGEINRRLCSNQLVQGEGGFITLLYGVLENNQFHWTSAGHCLPLLQNRETGVIVELGDARTDGGPPLAVIEEAEYETVVTEIPPGHRMLIYTDGLVEAFPDSEDDHKEFGLSGVRDSLAATREASIDQALDALFANSFAFTAGAGRHDDTSVLLLERQ